MGSDLCFTRAKGSMKDSGLTIEDTEWATRNTKMEIYTSVNIVKGDPKEKVRETGLIQGKRMKVSGTKE